MAISTVGEVLNKAAALLNDVAKTVYTDLVMTPFLVIAFDELQIALDGYQLPFVNVEDPPVVVPIGDTTIPIPDTLVRPIELLERLAGSTRPEDYGPMSEMRWDPHITPGRELNYWAWVGTTIIFPEATTDREVILRYVGQFTPLTEPVDTDETVQLQRIHVFMQYRIAGLAAEFIMQDDVRAGKLNGYAREALDAILRAAVRSRQALPTKRRPFRYAWNMRIQRRLY